jgi:hypothetical protein
MSPDLVPLFFFLWGLQSEFYMNKPRDIGDLNENIPGEAVAILPDTGAPPAGGDHF